MKIVDPIRVIVDTDIGSDLDDALALAYLLSHPRCDLIGITTTTGQPVQRARLASTICHHAQRRIPIHAGRERSLAGEPMQPDVPQAAALRELSHGEPEGRDGARYLVETVADAPGTVVLLCLAPLTTVATALALDPGFTSNLDSIVVMGGHFGNLPDRPRAEWNFHCDPLAAATVFQQARCPIRVVSLDVTHEVPLTEPELRAAANTSPILHPVIAFSGAHFNQYPQVYLHDPLAAATVFDPAVCDYHTGAVSVRGAETSVPGVSDLVTDPNGSHLVTTQVDRRAFMSDFLSTLAGRDPSSGSPDQIVFPW